MTKRKHLDWSNQQRAELTEIWQEAWEEGIWLQIVDGTPGHCMAAAGSLRELKRFGAKIEKWALRKIWQNKLEAGDCRNLGAVPGVGKTPVEACRNAIRLLRRILKQKNRG